MILQALLDIWDVESEIAAGWALIAENVNTDLEALGAGEDNMLPEVKTIGDAFEHITVADLLNQYPKGFTVGPTGFLYEVIGTGEFDEKERVGRLFVRPIAGSNAASSSGDPS
jgi:hypothetical protein